VCKKSIKNSQPFSKKFQKTVGGDFFDSHCTSRILHPRTKFRENRTIRCFPIWLPSAMLKLKIWILLKSLYHWTVWFSVSNFVIIGSFITELCRHNDFDICGFPPCLICGDVVILAPVIEWHDGRSIVQSRWLVSLISYKLHMCASSDRQTDRQTERLTDGRCHCLKALRITRVVA